MALARPALDPQPATLPADMSLVTEIDAELLAQFRHLPSAGIEDVIGDRRIARREVSVPGADGAEVPLTVFSPSSRGGFDALFPQASLSVAARRTRAVWLTRILNSTGDVR